MHRRDFLSSVALAPVVSSLLSPDKAQAAPTPPSLTEEPTLEPSPAQKKWMELGFGMFVHFSINTYYDKEWSDGTLDPKLYNPTKLNTDQWAETAANAGMKYLVIITKHHDGFCNWPTALTPYSVKNTPFGQDLLRRVVDSCRKHGLQVGFYYSLWDRNNKVHDTDEHAYADFMRGQLTELLTGYGPLCEIWFDGYWKKQRTGWSHPDKTPVTPQEQMAAWRNEGAFRWEMDSLYQLIKKHQPDCMVMNNATTSFPGTPLFPCDIRSGERATDEAKPDQKIWNFAGHEQYLPLQMETTMSTYGSDKMFAKGNWFWHPNDHSVASADTILAWHALAKKNQANLLLNCGPSPEGLLRPEDIKALAAVGKKLKG